jgi:hypothetical protein
MKQDRASARPAALSGNRLDVFGSATGIRCVDRTPDDAQYLAPPERHAHQRSCREWKLTSVSQGAAKRTVGRRRDDHGHFMAHGELRLAASVEVIWRNIG